jgi:hypothetical protein
MENETKNELITEGSALIAEFMGIEVVPYEHWLLGDVMAIVPKEGIIDYPLNVYNPSEDWNLLMPACYKWDTIEFANSDSNTKKRYMGLCDQLDHTVSCYEILPTFDQLVKNLKWYNETQSRGGGN